MATRKMKRFDIGGDTGIPAQTEDEASNEAALNADLPRRRMGDAAMAEGAKDEKAYSGPATAPETTEEPAKPAAKTPAKTSTVTKEELAKSGLSLRDYMNKQQGLTRRSGSAPAAKPASASYSNEGKNVSTPAKKYETPYDRMNRQTREQNESGKKYGAETDAETARLAKRAPYSPSPTKPFLSRAGGGTVKKMASGGSVSSASSRGDGIATKGKTRGTMVMCGGGMAKGKK